MALVCTGLLVDPSIASAVTRIEVSVRGEDISLVQAIEGEILRALSFVPGSASFASAGSVQPTDASAPRNAELRLVAILDLEAGLAALELFDLRQADAPVVGRGLLSLERDKRAGTLFEETLPRLLESSGLSLGGKLRVLVRPDGARVFVDDQPAASFGVAGATGVEAEPSQPDVLLVLPAGAHTLSARLDGWVPFERSIALVAGQEARFEAQLEEDSSLLGSPWLWIGAGVVLGTTVAILLAGAGGPTTWCHARTEELCE
ncbi:MAG: hypothetical protein HYV07_20565 [Deltaproteobacteria bacterium]|nr:hypothetical protein [Deltaproteobacteria bacterium]